MFHKFLSIFPQPLPTMYLSDTSFEILINFMLKLRKLLIRNVYTKFPINFPKISKRGRKISSKTTFHKISLKLFLTLLKTFAHNFWKTSPNYPKKFL